MTMSSSSTLSVPVPRALLHLLSTVVDATHLVYPLSPDERANLEHLACLGVPLWSTRSRKGDNERAKVILEMLRALLAGLDSLCERER